MKNEDRWRMAIILLYNYVFHPKAMSVIMQTHQDEHLPEDNGMMIATWKAASIVNSSRLLDDPTIQAGFTCSGH